MAKVLVVDDAPEMVRLEARIVSSMVDDVLTAHDGHTAMKLAVAEHPDLILLDIMMPGMTGFELLRQLKSREDTCDILVILVTANGEDHDVILGLDEGAFDYVTKPFRTEVLAARVRSALRFKDSADALQAANQQLEQTLLERQRMELELAQAQKLESIGRLAAGIAHEINTPAQYIGDNTRFLRDVFGDVDRLLRVLETINQRSSPETPAERLLEDLRAVVNEIDIDYIKSETPVAIEQSLEGIERVTNIVGAMKEFSHPGQCEKQPIDINHAIESTLTISRNEWKYVANVVTDFDESLPLVPCLVGDFNQAILNLVVNAAQSIGNAMARESQEQGTITVRTRHDKDRVEISIADSGGGIPQDIQDKIFEPFFTTKEVGKGTGQGLAIVQSIITQKHGGEVGFESQEGTGATFFIRLPIKAEKSTLEVHQSNVTCGVS